MPEGLLWEIRSVEHGEIPFGQIEENDVDQHLPMVCHEEELQNSSVDYGTEASSVFIFFLNEKP